MPAAPDRGREELLFLRLYVDGADRAWSLPLVAIKALLDRLDGRVSPTFAVIDGHEPASGGDSTRRLIALLRFYDWEPVLVVRGALPARFEGFFAAGLSWIHLELEEKTMFGKGLAAVRRFYRAAAKGPMALTASYRLSPGRRRASSLRRLFALDDFNKLPHPFIILPEAEEEPRPGGPFAEFIIGHRGTMSFGAHPGTFLPGNLLEKGWEAALAKNIARLKEARHAAV